MVEENCALSDNCIVMKEAKKQRRFTRQVSCNNCDKRFHAFCCGWEDMGEGDFNEAKGTFICNKCNIFISAVADKLFDKVNCIFTEMKENLLPFSNTPLLKTTGAQTDPITHALNNNTQFHCEIQPTQGDTNKTNNFSAATTQTDMPQEADKSDIYTQTVPCTQIQKLMSTTHTHTSNLMEHTEKHSREESPFTSANKPTQLNKSKNAPPPPPTQHTLTSKTKVEPGSLPYFDANGNPTYFLCHIEADLKIEDIINILNLKDIDTTKIVVLQPENDFKKRKYVILEAKKHKKDIDSFVESFLERPVNGWYLKRCPPKNYSASPRSNMQGKQTHSQTYYKHSQTNQRQNEHRSGLIPTPTYQKQSHIPHQPQHDQTYYTHAQRTLKTNSQQAEQQFLHHTEQQNEAQKQTFINQPHWAKFQQTQTYTPTKTHYQNAPTHASYVRPNHTYSDQTKINSASSNLQMQMPNTSTYQTQNSSTIQPRMSTFTPEHHTQNSLNNHKTNNLSYNHSSNIQSEQMIPFLENILTMLKAK